MVFVQGNFEINAFMHVRLFYIIYMYKKSWMIRLNYPNVVTLVLIFCKTLDKKEIRNEIRLKVVIKLKLAILKIQFLNKNDLKIINI